jgi:DNA recombination protein RmuC
MVTDAFLPLVVALLGLILLIVLFRRVAEVLTRFDVLERTHDRVENSIREELARSRAESARSERELREELRSAVKDTTDSLVKGLIEISGAQKTSLDSFADHLKSVTDTNRQQVEALREGIETRLRLVQEDTSRTLDRVRTESSENDTKMREGLIQALKDFNDSLVTQVGHLSTSWKLEIDGFSDRLGKLIESNERRLDQARTEASENAVQTRAELGQTLKNLNDSVLRQIGEGSALQKGQLDSFAERLCQLTESNETKLDELRASVDARLRALQEDNSQKLELMRQTVDEKLQGTLDKRLGESFKLVSDRLELVHRGLGEMQTLASGVGDLKRVLTNVKTRGNWGEFQVQTLLEQILSPEQYASNVTTKESSGERVEFAIKLPGPDGKEPEPVWLPIDAKFPVEDYQRLMDAADKGDANGVEAAARDLERRIRSSARGISEKYINPPRTTDFGILYLPTEGLYAEVLRREGLFDSLQREYRVTVVGPTTLGALLNSLQMGFRTLAIQKRSSEVWAILGAVKAEFGKFADVLTSVQKKLAEASATIDKAGVRTRAITRKLREVEELPAADARALLGSTDPVEPDVESVEGQ